MKLYTLIIIACLALITACQGQGIQQEETISPQQLGEEAVIDQTKADEAKKILISMEEVIAVKGVNYEEDIYIASKVRHLDRLQLENIRKTGFEKIKKRYPEANVHLSTDAKVFMELEELENKLKKNEISKSQTEKQVKKIEEDMKR
ncbi:hypothetical protein [Desertibacillus haloalkaliphilus]|uniref:hypothetical protein n=1 Tax=Desertibacillus haloalkaliphilus TaxID=1328930 RepID=UPI001C26D53D|nr:hypothetical protein [Desertibacillus haloalkaliphilus]MBU8907164.1 hypothetical protein [Desertibacillus haloalkaliphilus]